jgi:hypothetical protein
VAIHKLLQTLDCRVALLLAMTIQFRKIMLLRATSNSLSSDPQRRLGSSLYAQFACAEHPEKLDPSLRWGSRTVMNEDENP